MKKYYSIAAVLALISAGALFYQYASKEHAEESHESMKMGLGQKTETSNVMLPGENKKCALSGGYYFIYKFAEKVELGTVVLKVQIFDSNGKQTTGFDLKGQYDMPAMSGHHDSGEQEFKLNRKGDYLLPVNIVMPGEWEVNLIFLKDQKEIYRGMFRFEV